MEDPGMRLYAMTSLFVGVFICTLLVVLVVSLSSKVPPKQGVDPACNGPTAHAYACSVPAKAASSGR